MLNFKFEILEGSSKQIQLQCWHFLFKFSNFDLYLWFQDKAVLVWKDITLLNLSVNFPTSDQLYI